MKIKTVIHLLESEIEPSDLEHLAAQVEVSVSIKLESPAYRAIGNPSYWVTVRDDLLGAERLLAELRRRGVEPYTRFERTPTKGEVLGAPFCVIGVARAPRGLGGPVHHMGAHSI